MATLMEQGDGQRDETVVIYGGSFNPPHVSHCLAVTYLRLTEKVDRILVVPTFKHPFDKALADFSHRRRMCELAFAHEPLAEVSSIEEELAGESRTLRTLLALAERHPRWKMRLLMGGDILLERHKWFGFDRIVAMAEPLVLGRAGYEAEGAPPAVLPEVSSTDIRERLARGDSSVARVLPSAVLDYVREHGLYGSQDGSGEGHGR